MEILLEANESDIIIDRNKIENVAAGIYSTSLHYATFQAMHGYLIILPLNS
jgi:hypothetical protein